MHDALIANYTTQGDRTHSVPEASYARAKALWNLLSKGDLIMSNTRYYSLANAAKLFQGNSGKPLHPSTLYRWCTKGVNGVYLEYEQMGRRMYTNSEYLRRFSEELKEKRKKKTLQSSRERRKDKDEIYKKNLKNYGLNV